MLVEVDFWALIIALIYIFKSVTLGSDFSFYCLIRYGWKYAEWYSLLRENDFKDYYYNDEIFEVIVLNGEDADEEQPKIP